MNQKGKFCFPQRTQFNGDGIGDISFQWHKQMSRMSQNSGLEPRGGREAIVKLAKIPVFLEGMPFSKYPLPFVGIDDIILVFDFPVLFYHVISRTSDFKVKVISSLHSYVKIILIYLYKSKYFIKSFLYSVFLTSDLC